MTLRFTRLTALAIAFLGLQTLETAQSQIAQAPDGLRRP